MSNAQTKPTFTREQRYVVLKVTDLQAALSREEKKDVEYLCELVNRHRQARNKSPLMSVVVEHDWPEYEPTWRAIEARVMQGQQPPSGTLVETLERENNALRLKLAETEGRLEALRESRRPVVEVKP